MSEELSIRLETYIEGRAYAELRIDLREEEEVSVVVVIAREHS